MIFLTNEEELFAS